MTVQDRLQRHPQMRATTLAYLQKRDATTAQLQREIRAKAEADARANQFRDDIGYQSGTSALLLIAGRLKVLALKAKEILN
jgi:hypothetical protein